MWNAFLRCQHPVWRGRHALFIQFRGDVKRIWLVNNDVMVVMDGASAIAGKRIVLTKSNATKGRGHGNGRDRQWRYETLTGINFAERPTSDLLPELIFLPDT